MVEMKIKEYKYIYTIYYLALTFIGFVKDLQTYS